MNQRSRRPQVHAPQSRWLAAERLEPRQLLASDLPQNLHDLTSANGLTDVPAIYRAVDTGGTRTTALALGNLEGTRQISESLGRTDRVDVFSFLLARPGNVDLALTRLSRDANLSLSDADGTLLRESRRSGRNNEAIQTTLGAGLYYVTVTGVTTSGTAYRLTLNALLQPPAASIPSVSTDGSSANPTNSTIQPLAEVPYYGNHNDWSLNQIHAPEAWAAGYSGQGVVVAVIDTGVDLDHPELISNLYVNPREIPGNGIDDDGNGFRDDVSGYDFIDRDTRPDDLNGHGTHVAGIIAAAKNNSGATGVAPAAKILPVRVLDRDGSGTDAQVAAGIRYAAQLGADIINLSLGGVYSRAMESAISYARSVGSFIVAAAGNESAAVPGYPARFSATQDHVLSVGAYQSSGALAAFSNRVGGSGAVQIDAPGSAIYSTYLGGGHAYMSGTSMATPQVSGLAALVLSANPRLTNPQLRSLLTTGSTNRSLGSDSLGNASALRSVAFAAAGQTAVNLPTTSNLPAASPSSVPTTLLQRSGLMLARQQPATLASSFPAANAPESQAFIPIAPVFMLAQSRIQSLALPNDPVPQPALHEPMKLAEEESFFSQEGLAAESLCSFLDDGLLETLITDHLHADVRKIA